jgi:endonuclease/exonuclease/phosphatase family metal-dependent hydrolase
LGGDFNATPEESPLAAFTSPWLNPKKHGTNTGTIPAAAPTREIDFILLKPAANQPAPTVLRSEVIEEKVASDHRPIVMELQIAAPP